MMCPTCRTSSVQEVHSVTKRKQSAKPDKRCLETGQLEHHHDQELATELEASITRLVDAAVANALLNFDLAVKVRQTRTDAQKHEAHRQC